jgi:hypothetical protein
MSEHHEHPKPHEPARHGEHAQHAERSPSNVVLLAIAFAAVLILFNQWQIFSMSSLLQNPATFGRLASPLPTAQAGVVAGAADLSLEATDLSGITSTAQSLARVFPELTDGTVTDVNGAVKVLIPTGMPVYGQALGISYDDPVGSLKRLHRQVYPAINAEAKQDPALWKRYLDLVTKPVGISCEHCCGVGPIGVTATGQSRCGCSHNPAILGLTLWLMKNTDMNDAEILREALKWKALWFPKNMIQLAAQISGGDASVLQDVPGMVGGC